MDSDEDTKDGIIVHPDDPVPWFPGQEEDQSPEFDLPNKPARLKRRRRCGQCGPCQIRSNCGECSYCLRRSVLKQSCIYRKCIYLRKPVSGTLKTPPRRRPNGISQRSGNHPDFMSSSCDEELDSSFELMSPPGIDINGFTVGEISNGDDTEILIEDYTPTPSIIIGGFDDDPQDSQPSSPIQIPNNHEGESQSSSVDERIKTPPHPMDCEDEDSCVNPKQFNASRATEKIESSSAWTVTSDDVPSSVSKDVSESMTESYPLSIIHNEMKTTNAIDYATDSLDQSHCNSTKLSENCNSVQSVMDKDTAVSKSSSEHSHNRLSESHSAISKQLFTQVPVECDVDTQSKQNNQNHTVNRAGYITGTARLPVLQPAQSSQHPHPTSENHPSHQPQNVHHNFQVPKPQSISATYDEAHRQFFSPPNVTVTGHGGFSSHHSSNEASGSQSHKPQPASSYTSKDYDHYPRGPHPAWYSGMPMHPHAYPPYGIPRGMYPPHYALDPMVYPVHPTQNPFHRLEGYGSHPMHSVILPRMVPPRFYPHIRHPSEYPYNPILPSTADQDFSIHPDFRKRSAESGARPTNEQPYLSAKDEIEEYKKHSVFRIRANSFEKPKSPFEREGASRVNQEAASSDHTASSSGVPERTISEQSSSSNSSVPTNRNDVLRKLLSHTTSMHAEHRANTAVDDDLQKEMSKIRHHPCSVVNIDDLRMPNMVRGDAVNVESSSPNSSNSSESTSTSPLMVEKDPLSNMNCSEQVPRSVKIQGNVCIKQDLGDEGIVMLEFQGCRVDLVQCVLDEAILKLSNNPTELKDYIEKSQLTNKTTELPSQNEPTVSKYSSKTSYLNDKDSSNSVEGTSQGVASSNNRALINRGPPQLQRLGVPVRQSNSPPNFLDSSLMHPQTAGESNPYSERNDAPTSSDRLKTIQSPPQHFTTETEGWKKSYLKMFSNTHPGSAEEARQLTDSETDHVAHAVESLSGLCEFNNCPQNSEKSLVPSPSLLDGEKLEVSHISDKNIFDTPRSSVNSPDPEKEKTINVESGLSTLKRSLEETESENTNCKRSRPEHVLTNENENETSSAKSDIIVNKLTKFVDDTIESYTNATSPALMPGKSDAMILCDEYQNPKESSDTLYHEVLSQKNVSEIEKKISCHFS